MDPRYPPLVDPLSYTSADLMAFLARLMHDGTPTNYADISYDWYSGTASIERIETYAPEPGRVALTGLSLMI